MITQEIWSLQTSRKRLASMNCVCPFRFCCVLFLMAVATGCSPNSRKTTPPEQVQEAPASAYRATFRVGHRPRSIASTPDGSRAYVNAENDGTVVLVDAVRFKTIPLGKPGVIKPMAVLLSPDATRLYVSTGRGQQVFTVDAATQTVLGSVTVGKRPWGIALSPDAKTLYSANGPSNNISVVNLADNTVAATIPAGAGPWGVIVLPR
jgi:YVTN family beta-propeller protein